MVCLCLQPATQGRFSSQVTPKAYMAHISLFLNILVSFLYCGKKWSSLFLLQCSKCKCVKCMIIFRTPPCAIYIYLIVISLLFPFQNMLFEIEQKVAYLSELSVHSESLLLEGRAETKGEAEQLTFKLRSLKDSLMELQQMLQDKQVDIQVSSGLTYVLFDHHPLCLSA